MGLLTGLLTLPLAPVRGVTWVAEQLQQQAEAELNDPARLRAQLEEIEKACAAGEISEAERDELQEQVLARLVDIPGPPGEV